MPLRIVDAPTLRAERRLGTHEYTSPATIWDQPFDVPVRLAAGEMDTYELNRPMREYLSMLQARPQAAGEIIATPANLAQFVTKTVVDLNLGREQVPLLYPAVYTRTITDANLTENVDVGAIMARASVVFLQHMEGGEVRFGTRTLSPRQTVPLLTYAAGFEYTEDIVEYDKTWEISQLNEAIGRAYNALLNHIHLYPITSYTYATKNQTPADSTGTTFREKMRATLKAALIHSGSDTATDTGLGRSPNVLLAHSSRRWDIEEALQRFVVTGTEYPALAGIDTLVFYDGYSITVGARKYVYPGVATNKAYLVDTSTYLIELVKHDLRTDAGVGDLSRLIQQQIVARARRGVFVSPPNCVEEVTLP